MKCSLDKVLLDARQLANKIRASDEAADILIRQASDAHNKMMAKKVNQEETLSFEELYEVSKNRPRHKLMMSIAAENKQLELLKQENKILRTSLIEYETTFQMIIKKFKKHKILLKNLVEIEKGDKFISKDDDSEKNVSENHILIMCSKIAQLKREIEIAMKSDNKITDNLSEIETKLIIENRELRNLLKVSDEFKIELINATNESSVAINSNNNGLSNDSHSNKNENNSHVLTNKSKVNGISLTNNKFVNKIFTKPVKDLKDSSPISITSEINDLEDDDDHSSVASDASVATIIG